MLLFNSFQINRNYEESQKSSNNYDISFFSFFSFFFFLFLQSSAVRCWQSRPYFKYTASTLFITELQPRIYRPDMSVSFLNDQNRFL